MEGSIHSIETFGAADGPGVRCVVFMQGCPLRCAFCHNPETWSGSGEIWEAEALWKKISRYKNYWGKDGGITASGGEPLLQPEFVTELFTYAKNDGVNTALDTSGQPYSTEGEKSETFERLINVTDLVILDLKLMDEEGHIKLTGHSNRNILRFARRLSERGKPLWIRRVLVPTVTDSEADLLATRRFIDTLDTVEKVEVLPYHTLGIYKWEKLGLTYTLKDVPTPTPEQLQRAREILGER